MIGLVKSIELSIANLSCMTEQIEFLLQVSSSSKVLENFIEKEIPDKEKLWLRDLDSWKLKSKWLLKISDICLKEYDQVFFDCGEELLDLNDSKHYQSFREKILEEFM